MIITPKYKDMIADRPIKFGMQGGGEFRLITRNSMGGVVQDTGWFGNLILNTGLLNMGNINSWPSRFHIGDSSIPPDATQSTLFGWLAQSGTQAAGDINENLGTPDYEGRTTRSRRFAAGVGTGTIQEVGISNSSSNSNLSIRALVTPPVNKAVDQVLDMFYRFTAFPSQADDTGQVTIDGILYNYLARPCNIDQTSYVFSNWTPDSSFQRVYDGDIGGLFNLPSGSFDAASSLNTDSVTATTSVGTINYNMFFDLDDGNLGSGVRSIASMFRLGFGSGSGLKLQVQFGSDVGDLPIPKVNTKVLQFDLKLERSRH